MSLVYDLVVAHFLGVFVHSSSWFPLIHPFICINYLSVTWWLYDCPPLTFTSFPLHHSFSLTSYPPTPSFIRMNINNKSSRVYVCHGVWLCVCMCVFVTVCVTVTGLTDSRTGVDWQHTGHLHTTPRYFSSLYYFPQYCMTYRLFDGAGSSLATNFFYW